MDLTAGRGTSALMTPRGYDRLRDELHYLCVQRRDEVAAWLRAERQHGGDPSENAGLALALEEQDRLEHRIAELETTLADAQIAAPTEDGTAGVGSRVRVRARGREPVEYELVGAHEADPGSRRISIASPVGQALLGHAAGAVVEIETPRGTRRLEILAVEHSRPAAAA